VIRPEINQRAVIPWLALILCATGAAACKRPTPPAGVDAAAPRAGQSAAGAGSADAGVPTIAALLRAEIDAGTLPPPPPPPPRSGDLIATIETSVGAIDVRLFADKAPQTVANFVGLAQGSKPWKDPRSGQTVQRPFYDGLPFHRVAPSLVVQTGDPLGDGTGGPGFAFGDEFHPDLRHNRPGVVTMANRGKNTNGSQFMITLRPLPLLDGRNAIFGEVVNGMKVVEEIARVPTVTHKPTRPVIIRRIQIRKIV
jgi:peptidyl-prolyl cis-trans isomerase A (cyclophilin A)